MGVSGQTLNRVWTKARASNNWPELGVHDLRHSGQCGSGKNVFPGSEPVRTPERPNRLPHLRPASLRTHATHLQSALPSPFGGLAPKQYPLPGGGPADARTHIVVI